MTLPWVRRARFEALEKERDDLKRELTRAHMARQRDAEENARLLVGANARLEAAEAERKTLLDRVVQMSGQPPIYAAPQAAPVAAVPENQPMPKTRVTFEDIHEAFRGADKNGQLTVMNGRVVAKRA